MVIDQLEAHIQICTKVCMGSQVIRLRYPNIMLSFFTPTPWSYQVALSLHTEVFEEAANCHLHQKPNLKSCQIDKNEQKSPQPLLIVQMNVSCSDTTGGLKLFHFKMSSKFFSVANGHWALTVPLSQIKLLPLWGQFFLFISKIKPVFLAKGKDGPQTYRLTLRILRKGQLDQ